MNIFKLFRVALVASFTLDVAIITSDFWLEDHLPAVLIEYNRNRYEGELSLSDWILGGLTFVLLLLQIASKVGLFLWRSWARVLFLFTSVGFWGSSPLFGPAVSTGLDAAAISFADALYGAIIALAYFSPVAERFQRRKKIVAAAVS